ncbi:MAG: tetratricopeptide repeat protein [Deltaproteobacteria bacterium]|nr:tetratricopeptide repeat protein [Deltaproteobacteria bacterium]
MGRPFQNGSSGWAPSPRGRARWLAAALVASVVWCLAACGPSYGEAFLRPYRAAQRAYGAGRYDEAAQLFEEAAGQASRLKDRDEAYFMQARMYERLGQWDQVRATYRRLIELSPTGPRTARAVFELASVEIAQGDGPSGWALLKAAIERYPNHGSGRRALTRWAAHTSAAAGEEQLIAQLDRWLSTFARTDLEQQVKVERGRALYRSGKLPEARIQLVTAAREHPYPKGSLTDDALLQAAEIAEELQDYPQAIADLRELLAARELATGGSYERPLYPVAQLRIARVYRDRLKDRKAALRELRLMYIDHAESILADDAMWEAALLWRELGDGDEACDLAEDLRDREPPSRYRRCVHELCAKVPVVAGERPCPAYLSRQL